MQKGWIFSLCKLLFAHWSQQSCLLMNPQQRIWSLTNFQCIVLGCVYEYFRVCWSWALNAFIHKPLYKWSKARLLDLECNKSSAFRFTGLETIVEILVPHIQMRKLESSIAHFGQMPLEVPKLLCTSNRLDRSSSASTNSSVVLGTVCLHRSCFWRLLFTAWGLIVTEEKGVYLNICKMQSEGKATNLKSGSMFR